MVTILVYKPEIFAPIDCVIYEPSEFIIPAYEDSNISVALKNICGIELTNVTVEIPDLGIVKHIDAISNDSAVDFVLNVEGGTYSYVIISHYDQGASAGVITIHSVTAFPLFYFILIAVIIASILMFVLFSKTVYKKRRIFWWAKHPSGRHVLRYRYNLMFI